MAEKPQGIMDGMMIFSTILMILEEFSKCPKTLLDIDLRFDLHPSEVKINVPIDMMDKPSNN